ncbi:MAG: GFA family protein [Woeseiaceae bacterium]|nr:GFA family protein [Woeseiaceae bacterium]
MTESRGSCLCGAVTYTVTGRLRGVIACHCEQCRRTSGHFVAATACTTGQLAISGSDTLRWYRSSPEAERGFCSVCGSSLFWRPGHGRYVAIMAGTLARPTGLATIGHIHTDSASDYYAIDDGLPQFPGDSDQLWTDLAE